MISTIQVPHYYRLSPAEYTLPSDCLHLSILHRGDSLNRTPESVVCPVGNGLLTAGPYESLRLSYRLTSLIAFLVFKHAKPIGLSR